LIDSYGHLGRTILLQHYLNLLHWGLLPELDVDPIDGTYPTSPLTPLEFITHVVVPEAAILLIMGDQGWTGEYNDTTEQWGKARQKAYNTWLKSGEYGRARFSTDDAEGTDILSSIQDRTKEIKRACKRRRKGKIVKKPLVAPRSVSPVKRLGSRHPIEVVNIELDSSQSTLDKSRNRQSSIALDTATPKGREQSPFRVEFSPVSSLGNIDLSQLTAKSDGSSQQGVAAPQLEVAKTKLFDRTISDRTASSYGMEDDWLGTKEAQEAAAEAERDRFGQKVVF